MASQGSRQLPEVNDNLYIQSQGVAGSPARDGPHARAQNLELAAGQSWEEAWTEIREELELPSDRYKLALNRFRNGIKYRIARSAWGKIRPGEEILLDVTPISPVQDAEIEKKEAMPNVSPRRAASAAPPMSPKSLAGTSNGRRSPSAAKNAEEAPRQESAEVTVPATPSNTDDSEDEDIVGETEGDKSFSQSERSPSPSPSLLSESAAAYKRMVRQRAASSTAHAFDQAGSSEESPSQNTRSPSRSRAPSPGVAQTLETSTVDSVRRKSTPRQLVKRESPVAESADQDLLARQGSGATSSETADIKPVVPQSNPDSASTSHPSLPAQAHAPVASLDQSASLKVSSSQESSVPTASSSQARSQPSSSVKVHSSQPSTSSDVSWRVGIDSTGQIGIVPASSPRLSTQQLPPPEQAPMHSTQDSLSSSQPSVGSTENDEHISSSEGEEVVLISPKNLKRKRACATQRSRSRETASSASAVASTSAAAFSLLPEELDTTLAASSLQAHASTSSASVSRPPVAPRAPRQGFILEVESPPRSRSVGSSPPMKRPRLAVTQSQPIFRSLASSDDTYLAASQPQLVAARSSGVAARSTPQKKTKPRPRSSLASAQRMLKSQASALAAERVPLPAYPSSGRFCLYLRLPNWPPGPRWANAGLRPKYVVKYHGDGKGGTLGHRLHVIFEHVAAETGFQVRDLRLRFRRKKQRDPEDDGDDAARQGGEDEREEGEFAVWGFDVVLTEFMNLEELGVADQDFCDIDVVPFSPSRRWQDTE
ncbi:hypothetical protein JCM10212_000643 [Sporobolomyces blumeae]